MILKQLIRRAIIGAKADSLSYVSFLRKKGVKVGGEDYVFLAYH